MARDPELRAHLEWLGYVQPVGLVVSPPALLNAQAHINRNIIPEHRKFLELVTEAPTDNSGDPVAAITDVPRFFEHVLGWEPGDLCGGLGRDPIPTSLEVTLTAYNETLRPSYAVPEFSGQDGDENGDEHGWLMLIETLPVGADFDKPGAEDDGRWQASPHARFERLLRETEVPIGLLVNKTSFRLVYAPRGETSGFATFKVAEMAEVAGRPIFAAMHLLLSAERLFSLPEKQRLQAILSDSRKYQNDVSTKLAEQVLASLYELLRGFQAADDLRHGELLREVLRSEPNHVYAGLLIVLLRLVFILYAEDRGLLSTDEVYVNHYSVTALFERLRDEANRYPDTMDQRYGAWAQLLTLFRVVYDGANHGGLHLPPRHGYLFHSDRYPFLEGRPWESVRQVGKRLDPPLVSDGVIFRVLRNLLILDGERLSYRSLDVEQIGSVYETMMGFNLETAKGKSIAIKPKKRHGAPSTINLDALLEVESGKRAKWVLDNAEQKTTGKALKGLKEANTPEGVIAALDRKVASTATPSIVPAGAMILQPSDERRRSGSHYTPRSLTEPIVRTTLRPVLEQLGDRPTPNQVLDLKVCDPAMGSGAFLVEACRQLADALVKSWHDFDCVPLIPPDEDELLHARRLVAQRCLYGVDKNPLATDLAKLSLWLATLAKDHAFTFLDHSLRTGDSLVGLSEVQIAGFHWEPAATVPFIQPLIEQQLLTAGQLRQAIQKAEDEADEASMRLLLREADEAIEDLRLIGDLVISAYFSSGKKAERNSQRRELANQVESWLRDGEGRDELSALPHEMRSRERPVLPFHWHIEYPEVFGRQNQGFDVMVGNPPFLGGTRISTVFGMTYFQYLRDAYPPAGHLCDLVAHFFRRVFDLLRLDGAMGLIATNTIAQGDTRNGGLRIICENGGTVFSATSRFRWPGEVSVVATMIHIAKGAYQGNKTLDDRAVERITAYLFHAGGNSDPFRLAGRNALFSAGSKIYGQGFIFDDHDERASSLAEMERVIGQNPSAASRIHPYLGGNELNQSPTQSPNRYVIYLSDIETEEELEQWPHLTGIVREKVKPGRDRLGDNPNNIPLKRRWWAYQAHRPRLYAAMGRMSRVLICSQVTPHLAFAFQGTNVIFSQKLIVFLLERYGEFALLQSRAHELWARFFSSTSMDLLSYTPSDSFETFPFPEAHEKSGALEAAGKAYYEYRADLMIRNGEGLTKTYNRVHDPDERSPEIIRLRDLHDEMDRTVLDAYGWTDFRPACEFLLDFEEEEDENGGGRQRKKPWRYRWSDEIHDEILARLLDLNEMTAKKEQMRGNSPQGGIDLSRATLPFTDDEEAN